MSIDAEFHFDFGSPNAYLAHRALPGIAVRTGVSFCYVPVLLGGVFKLTNNVSPAVSMQGICNKREYMQLEMQRFIRRHQISEFKWNPNFPVNTLQIMRLAVASAHEGVFAKTVAALFAAMWQDARKMDDPETIRETLDAAGLNAGALMARAQSQEVKDELARNTQSAVDRGSFGSPTLFVNGEIWFGKDRLPDVEAAIVTALAATPLT